MVSIVILIIELLFLHIIKLMGIESINNLVGTLLIIIFSVSFMISIQNSARVERYSIQLMSGYVFRMALLYFDLFGKSIRNLPQSGADTMMFYQAALRWALYGIESRRGSFVYLMGDLFKLIGSNRLYAQFLLMLLSIASLILFLLIIDEIVVDEMIKEKAAWILCLLPNYALLSSIFLRESLVTFLITSSIYFFAKWSRRGGTACLLFAIILSISGCLFHSGCIGISIGYMICVLLYDPYEQRIHTSLNGVVIAFVFALGMVFLFLNYGDILLRKFSRVETLQDIANTRAIAGSSYAQYVGNSNNPINMLVFTLPRIVYFLFSPFPWQWRGIADIIAFFFSGMFYLVTIKNAIEFLQRGEQQNREIVICMLIVAFFCTFIFAWGVNNTGTASRHRDKMVCLYGIIYAMTARKLETVSQR